MEKIIEHNESIEKDMETFLLDFHKVYKASALYPKDHPTLLSMFVKPFKDISSILELNEEVVIKYKHREGFFWNDIPVAKRYKFINDMGDDLFRRKIQSVYFLYGLKLIEIFSFLEVMTSDLRFIQDCGGPEKLLQSKGVRHIWFNEIDYGKILEVQKEDAEKAQEIVIAAGKEPASGEGIYGFVGIEEDMPEPSMPGYAKAAMAYGETSRPDLFPEETDELIKLWNEAKSYSDFEEIGNLLISKAFTSAAVDDTDTVFKIVRAFLAVSDLRDDEKYGKFASAGLDRIAKGEGPVDCLLNAALSRNVNATAASDILVGLCERAAGKITDRLAIEEDSYARRIMDSILVRIGRHAIPVLMERVNDSRWYMVRNIARILGEIGEDHGVEDALKRVLQHEDPRVRKEAVRAVSMIKGQGTFVILRNAIGDSDRDVAELAVVSIGMLRDDSAVELLADTFNSIEDAGIKKEALKALGRIGTGKAISFLAGIFGRKRWFMKRKDEEVKMMCAAALGEAGTEEAVKVLKEGVHLSKGAVRKACEDELRRLGHG